MHNTNYVPSQESQIEEVSSLGASASSAVLYLRPKIGALVLNKDASKKLNHSVETQWERVLLSKPARHDTQGSVGSMTGACC
ncbi:hypothetical protein H634G_11529 [Metarhizium anisopliae BRIP 53293]|uniref:Uncharacterized protein n=1 Tax=Metarhizium anisopliae BRIP 53293 TaxID=1291518 RepID=A0A0D9NH41_METAN|nr:hypothetical protein H634G_11529 [Metarhizium anisopliae BRIP 53293]